jgi:hypothetical protein
MPSSRYCLDWSFWNGKNRGVSVRRVCVHRANFLVWVSLPHEKFCVYYIVVVFHLRPMYNPQINYFAKQLWFYWTSIMQYTSETAYLQVIVGRSRSWRSESNCCPPACTRSGLPFHPTQHRSHSHRSFQGPLINFAFIHVVLLPEYLIIQLRTGSLFEHFFTFPLYPGPRLMRWKAVSSSVPLLVVCIIAS